MNPGVKPVMLLTKTPVPVPFVVLESAIVGLGFVLQQTPLAETVAPPSLVIFPPEVPPVEVGEVTGSVVTVGGRPIAAKLN